MSFPEGEGDHAGEKLLLSFVSGRTFVPSAFMIKRFLLPNLVDEKTIRKPSGDHLGFSFEPAPEVRITTSSPDGLAVAISKLLSKSTTNAIRSPRGDQQGESS